MNQRHPSHRYRVAPSIRWDQAVDTVWATIGRFPIGSKLGLVVIAGGLVADLVAHLGPAAGHDHAAISGPQLTAHLVVFLGMVAVLGGVVADGLRSSQRPRGVPVEEK